MRVSASFDKSGKPVSLWSELEIAVLIVFIGKTYYNVACESIRFSFALRRWKTSPAAKSEGETDAFAG